MTNAKLNEISEEIDHISEQISILDPDNTYRKYIKRTVFFIDGTL